MIVIDKTLKGLIPYRMVWFPTRAAARSLATELPLTHAARVEGADSDLTDAPCTVAHHVSLTLCLDLERPLGDLFGHFSATARAKIRRAEKLGSRVMVRRYDGQTYDQGCLDEFAHLVNDVALHKPRVVLPISSQTIASYFPHAELFLLDFDGQLITGHLCMRDPQAGKVRLLSSASRRYEDRDTSRLAGVLNVYLHWYEAQTYRAAGFATYDFGGISPIDNPGVTRFKRQFGGEIVRQHSYLFAGLPLLWRIALPLFTTFTRRGRRRRAIERAVDRLKDVPLEQLHELIENA